MQATNNSSKNPRNTILLIAEDNNVYSTLKLILRKEGYSVLMAVDAKDVYEWMSGGRIHADIILVDLVGKSIDEALIIGREVRRYARYDSHTPLVVMADKYSKDVEGTDVNVGGSDWIHYLGEDAYQLQNLLSRLLQQVGENRQVQETA